MRKPVFVTITLALALIPLVRPAAAGQAEVSRQEGNRAFASFFSASGCIADRVYVSVVDRTNQSPPGAPADSPKDGLSLAISRYDTCAEALLLDAYGEVAEAALALDPQLRSAALSLVVPVYDLVGGTAFDVAVDLSWTGAGELVRTNGAQHFRDAASGLVYNVRFNGTVRAAVASGSVRLADGSNATPAASAEAELAAGRFGEVIAG